tara:strand:- start:107 stop:481 length:375 start_codon:yes stop_codon:yes gene_type:complete
MVTMKEALARVDYNECNDWEKQFYDDQKDGSYEPRPKQIAVIDKMPKLANVSAPSQPDTSFDHGANVTQSTSVRSEPTRTNNVDGMIFELGEIVTKLNKYDWYNRLGDDAQQKHATTIFLSARK